MNKQHTTLAKSSQMPPYAASKIQEYFNFLSPGDARLSFQIRVQVFDVKRWKKYRYEDLNCRLCGADVEDINHVLNECTGFTRSPEKIADVYSLQKDKVEEIVKRIKHFRVKVGNLQTGDTEKILQHI